MPETAGVASTQPAMAGSSDSFAADKRLLTRRDLLHGVRSRFSDAGDPDSENRDLTPYWIRVHRPIMACRFEVVLPGEHGHHVPAARAALDAADRLEDVMTVFRETSELVRLNRLAHREPIATERALFSLLTLASELTRDTEGAFDITSTTLSRCWGFLKREGRLPSDQEIADARACVGMSEVVLDRPARTVFFRREGIELNLGSIGKGFALDRMAAQLRRAGVTKVLLSGGHSSVLASGGVPTPWPVHLWSTVRGERLAQLQLRHGAVGTSGAGEQFVEVGGVRYGHVIDPRTGWPASGTLSASVITSRAAVADALSTAFLIGGVDLARRYCENHEGVLALITPDDETCRPQVVGTYEGVRVEQL